MTEFRYKFLRSCNGEIRSERGDHTWTPNQWYTSNTPPALCSYGFHCSEQMLDAFGYVMGELVSRVEVCGESDQTCDKEAWSDMRLIDVRMWRKEDSVALAVFAAEMVLSHFENLYPDDSRPRQAINAAKTWSAAWSAESAASAAESAASAAESAAWSAARSAALSTINAWMEARFDSLPVFTSNN